MSLVERERRPLCMRPGLQGGRRRGRAVGGEEARQGRKADLGESREGRRKKDGVDDDALDGLSIKGIGRDVAAGGLCGGTV